MREEYPKPVQLEDGWTFVDKNGKLWEQRFKHAGNFRFGIALVQLEDGWTFVDKNGIVWEQRFENAYSFSEGLAVVQLEDGEYAYVNKTGDICPKNYVDDLRLIYNEPENFMTLPTEKFTDKKFVEAAVRQVKNSLTDTVASKDVVDDEYVKYVKELLSNVKEKVKRENTKLEEKETEQKKRDLIDKIKGFEL